MRTRIALVAIIPIALITVTLLTQAATAQPARASIQAPHTAVARATSTAHRVDRLTAYVHAATSITPTTLPDFHLAIALLAGPVIGHDEVTPVDPAPAAPVVVDTVTPGQRAAWNRVAVCEEGGNWQADGPRFSGGLGISRVNWSNYGGIRYASSAARATPDQQIMVAERIQSSPPDQHGCSNW